MLKSLKTLLVFVSCYLLVATAAKADYTLTQWGMNKGVSPYAFGANINGTWRDLGTVSSTGAWTLNPVAMNAIGSVTSITTPGQILKVQNSSTTREDLYNGVVPPNSWLYDGISSTINLPPGTLASNAQAFGAYVLNNSEKGTAITCPNGINNGCGNAVGVFSIVHCVASNSGCWAMNPTIMDTNTNAAVPGQTGVQLIGSELDVSVYSPTTLVSGYNATGSSYAQPAGADAFVVGNLRAGLPDTIYWTHGFVSNDATSQVGLYLGSEHLVANSASQPLQLSYRDGANASRAIQLQSVLGALNITNPNVALDGVYIQPATTNPTISVTGSSANANLNLSAKGAAGNVVFGSAAKINNGLYLTGLMISQTAPTIGSGFGTTPSIVASNGTAAFQVNVGTGGTASSGVVTLPAATTGWSCSVSDITTQSTSVFLTKQTASTTTSVTVTNYNTAGAATAWVASDKLNFNCMAF